MALDYTGAGAAKFEQPVTLGWGTPLPVSPETVLRLRLKIAKTAGANASVVAGLICFDDTMTQTGQKLDIVQTVSSTAWVTYEADFDSWPAGTARAMMVFQHQTEGSTVEVDSFSYENAEASALKATVEQNYYTKVSTDNAIAVADAALRTIIENPNGSSVGGAITDIKALESSALSGTAFGTLLSQLEVDANGTSAKIIQQSSAIATLEGNASVGYMIKAQAGSAVSLLDLIAADGTAGAVSVAKIRADEILLQGSVYANMMTIDRLLLIDSINAGFSMGKTSVADVGGNGLYMGRTPNNAGGLGFGFALGRTKPDGRLEFIEHTADGGLRMQNAQFVKSVGVPTTGTITTSQTLVLPPQTKSITITLVGGGQGGEGNYDETPVQPPAGGATGATLHDGAFSLVLGSAAGGSTAVGYPSVKDEGYPGQSSPYGTGGAPSKGVPPDPAPNGGGATGYGAGGGGAGGQPGYGPPNRGLGGEAGSVVEYTLDVSEYSNPEIAFTIGAAGAGSSYPTGTASGGNGSPGVAYYSFTSAEEQTADVVPLSPSFSGTMNSAGPFPDLGSGLWVLYTDWPDGGFEHLGLDETQISASGATIQSVYGQSATFVSDITPIPIQTRYGRTIFYHFYEMGQ